MASSQAEEQSLARVWSDAVFSLAASRGVEDSMLEEWRGLVELLDRDKDWKAVMAGPLVKNEEKRQLIERSFRGKASDLFVDTLQVMRSKGRCASSRPPFMTPGWRRRTRSRCGSPAPCRSRRSFARA